MPCVMPYTPTLLAAVADVASAPDNVSPLAQARAADLIGQRRIGIAIGAALGIGRHGDRARRDRQVGARIVESRSCAEAASVPCVMP